MIRAFKEEDTETVIRIWLAASVRSHSFIDKAYWEEKAEAMRTLQRYKAGKAADLVSSVKRNRCG